MFKVLIVDDEPFIRKGLVNIINWKTYNCQVCGEASDGVEGLEKIRDLEPDIVFVDINMPEINGLEMIKQSRDLLPGSKFIILTGYRDFSYLHEAIRLGAYDYILKPSKLEEISEILKRASLELTLEREAAAEKEKLKDKFEESIPILKEKLLFDLMTGQDMDADEIRQQMNLYDLSIGYFVLMYVSIDEEKIWEQSTGGKHLYQFGITNTVIDLYGDHFYIEKVAINSKVTAFVIQNREADEIEMDKVLQLASGVQQLIERCFNFTVTVSFSSVGRGAPYLFNKAKECDACLAYYFYMGPNSMILYDDIKGFYRKNDLSTLEKYEKQLSVAIQAGDANQVQKTLDEMKADIFQYNVKPKQIKHFYWSIVYHINHIRLSVKSMEASNNSINHNMSSLYQMIEESTNISEIHELLETAAIRITDKIHTYNQQNINVIIKRAVGYIHENYHRSLTLQDLADEVFVSTYYLSRMFTKELGKNFVDYLNEVRMDEARKLLETTTLKTYEISEKVGIGDSHYFSKLFKKYVGMTPTEFRSR